MIHTSRARRAAARRPLAVLAAALLLALGLPARASAHTRLEASTPSAGSVVPDTLREIRLRFTRAVSAKMTSLVLTTGAETVAQGDLTAVAGTDGKEYAFALPAALRPGPHTIVWHSAAADGHVIHGTITFTVEATKPAPDSAAAAHARGTVAPPPSPGVTADTESETTTPMAVAVRWGGFLALLGAIGAVAFYLLVLRRLRGDGALARVVDRAAYGAWHLAAAAAALSALTLVARLWGQATALYGANAFDGERLDTLLTGTLWGSGWMLQAIATVAFFVGLMVARAPHGRSVGWMGAAVAALLLAAVPALSGHAAAEERFPALAILVDTLHVLGAGVWLGTLAAVLAAGLPAAASAGEGEGTEAFAKMVARFSPVALAAGALVGVTGIVSSLFHFGSVPQLWTTDYGRALLVKLAVLAVVAGIGFYNWRYILPKMDDPASTPRLRRSARLEIGAGLLVVLVTAVLVALPTP